MASLIQSILKDCYRYPDRDTMPEEDCGQFLRPWGFITYRTFYGPGSGERWAKLLQAVTAGVKFGLNKMDGAEDAAATTKVLELFTLDARSDPALLDGLTLEDVRKLYSEGMAGVRLINIDNGPWHLFLLADAEVLGEADLRQLKVVEGDYDPVARVPKHTRGGPQSYFGWITMSSTTVAELWHELYSHYLWEIADWTTGEPGAFLDLES
jgi:hypothetical protein